MANYALIIAGGVGSRTQQFIPKQFITVNDKPIIVYTLEKFQNCDEIDGIVITCLEGWESCLKAFIKQYNITKVTNVITGGETRLDSIKNGIDKISEFSKPEDIIVLHDGIRPGVEDFVICDSIKTAKENKISVAFLHVYDTVYISDDFISSSECYNRDKLARGQTPVSIQYKYSQEVLNTIKEKNLDGGNCIATAVLAVGDKIYGSKGSEKNIKITTKEDIDMFKAQIMFLNKKD